MNRGRRNRRCGQNARETGIELASTTLGNADDGSRRKARLKIHGSKAAKCYRHLPFATGAVGTVAKYCYRCTTYASYLSCIIVQIQLTLLVRFITTYSDNTINRTLFNQTKCNHSGNRVLAAAARNPINLLPQK